MACNPILLLVTAAASLALVAASAFAAAPVAAAKRAGGPSLTPVQNCTETFKSCYFGSDGSKSCLEDIVDDGSCCGDYGLAVSCAHDIGSSYACEDIDLVSLALFYEDLYVNCESGEKPQSKKCFPGSASVQLKDGTTKPISAVELGDHVDVGGGVFSPVFFFSHRVTQGVFSFVRITSGSQSLTATGSHYVYANGALMPASRVAVGDTLTRADGSAAKVERVEAVTGEGLFNPHTMHGDVVVDGFVTSGYTTAVSPRVAAMLLAPLKMAYRAGVAMPRALDADAPRAVFEVLPVGSSIE